jgi:Tetratricopeptide repeat
MRYAKPCLLAFLALALSGCSMIPTRSTPAPVSDAEGGRGTKTALHSAQGIRRSDGVQVYAYRMASAPAAPLAVPAAPPEAPIPWTDAPLPGAAASPSKAEAAGGGAGSAPTTVALLTPPPYAGISAPVRALLRQAESQRAAGDLVAAAATLERGLRIAPRNPHLWNRLARVRLEQGQFSQADSLAAKSNMLAGNLPALTQDNLRIIALARRKGIR